MSLDKLSAALRGDKGRSLAALGLAMIVVGFASYAVVKGLKRPAPIVFDRAPRAATPRAAAAPDREAVVVVHAAGAVAKPGVLRLRASARVDDAIRAAGGALSDADLNAINLAAIVQDGSQIYVPRRATEESGRVADVYKGGEAASAAGARTSASSEGKGPKVPAGPVSLNTASSEQLQALPGIGPSTARKILDYRQAHGGFGSLDELLAVQGIGPKKLKNMRKYLRL